LIERIAALPRREAVEAAIANFAGLPAAAPEAEARRVAALALDAIERECLRVQKKATGYPRKREGISAAVWFDGAALGPMAEGLAALLATRGLHDLEEQAQALRRHAVICASIISYERTVAT